MKQETEELLQKWLRLEIAKFKWSLVTRVVMIALLILGLVLGAQIVEPLVTRQLQLLNAIQNSFVKTSGIEIKDEQNLLEVFNSLSPEQKQQVQQMLQEPQN